MRHLSLFWQLATTEGGAEVADGIEIDSIELQGPTGGQFTIGDGDGDSEDEDHEHGVEGAHVIRGEAGFSSSSISGDEKKNNVYSLTSFEPQLNMHLT